MIKTFFLGLGLFSLIGSIEAQDGQQTEKGNWLIDSHTGFSAGGLGHTAITGFVLNASNVSTAWAVGDEGGCFLASNLALKAGLGYGDGGVPNIMLSTLFLFR